MDQCPICYTKLEVRDCTPCHDCGALEEEVKHLEQGLHKYREYEVYQGLRLILCNFCDVDFGSYKSEYLGFKKGKRLGYEHFNFVREIEKPGMEKDKYCPTCEKRLKFLVFLEQVREINGRENA